MIRWVSGENRSVASAAATFGVSWDTVTRAVREDADRVSAAGAGLQVVAFGLGERVMNYTPAVAT